MKDPTREEIMQAKTVLTDSVCSGALTELKIAYNPNWSGRVFPLSDNDKKLLLG